MWPLLCQFSDSVCRETLKTTQVELDEVKSLYVNVCEAKDHLERNLTSEMEKSFEDKINRVF